VSAEVGSPVQQGPEPTEPRGPVRGPTQESAPARAAAKPRGRPKDKPAEKKSGIPGTILEIVVIVTAAFVIALLVQAFLIKPFTIHQVSMRPTLEEGDRILLNRLAYHFRDEARGDIVVFHSPITADEDLVKRIVAIAGDTVSVSGGKLYVNGVAQDEPYLLEQDFSGEMSEIEVPPGQVFVMGDNRNNSGDSRMFGPIPVDSIIGKAFLVYWPISHWKTQ
jgi:signal peptidase I